MISLKIVQKSVIISLIIQVTTTIIQLFGLFFKVSKKDEILRSVLKIETIVQIIEGIFYTWLAYSFYKLKDVTNARYYDWIITTPLMLLATIIYFKYLETDKVYTLSEFVTDNKKEIGIIFVYNWLMLLFGYLGEINYINLFTSISIGFIFFSFLFCEIYKKYVTTTGAFNLFIFLIIVWGLYGISAMMNVNMKNLMYNILDIVSKNFYGLFIFYKLYLVAK